MKSILVCLVLILAWVSGCSMGSAEREAAEVSGPSQQTREEQSSALPPSGEVTRRALPGDESFRATRAESSLAYADFDQRLARKLALDPSETARFLAIRAEGNRERLSVLDYMQEQRGLPRSEILARLKASATLADPAKLQRRLRALLGDSRYEQYLQLSRNQDELYR